MVRTRLSLSVSLFLRLFLGFGNNEKTKNLKHIIVIYYSSHDLLQKLLVTTIGQYGLSPSLSISLFYSFNRL